MEGASELTEIFFSQNIISYPEKFINHCIANMSHNILTLIKIAAKAKLKF